MSALIENIKELFDQIDGIETSDIKFGRWNIGGSAEIPSFLIYPKDWMCFRQGNPTNFNGGIFIEVYESDEQIVLSLLFTTANDSIDDAIYDALQDPVDTRFYHDLIAQTKFLALVFIKGNVNNYNICIKIDADTPDEIWSWITSALRAFKSVVIVESMKNPHILDLNDKHQIWDILDIRSLLKEYPPLVGKTVVGTLPI